MMNKENIIRVCCIVGGVVLTNFFTNTVPSRESAQPIASSVETKSKGQYSPRASYAVKQPAAVKKRQQSTVELASSELKELQEAREIANFQLAGEMKVVRRVYADFLADLGRGDEKIDKVVKAIASRRIQGRMMMRDLYTQMDLSLKRNKQNYDDKIDFAIKSYADFVAENPEAITSRIKIKGEWVPYTLDRMNKRAQIDAAMRAGHLPELKGEDLFGWSKSPSVKGLNRHGQLVDASQLRSYSPGRDAAMYYGLFEGAVKQWGYVLLHTSKGSSHYKDDFLMQAEKLDDDLRNLIPAHFEEFSELTTLIVFPKRRVN